MADFSPGGAEPVEEPPTRQTLISDVCSSSLPMPQVMPHSPGSPSLFHLHTSNTNVDVPSSMLPSISRTAISIPSICLRWLRLNVVQRILSAIVLIPLITVFLWLSPALATATFCTFVTSICSYEYAWLQHRIHLRVMTKLSACETELQRSVEVNQTREQNASRYDSSDSIERQSGNSGPRDQEGVHVTQSMHMDSGRTVVSTSDETVQLSVLPPSSPPRSSIVSSLIDDSIQRQQPGLNNVDQEEFAYLRDPSFSCSAVSRIADTYFHQNEWVAAVVLSAITTALTTTVFLVYISHIPKLQQKQLYKLRWFYSIATDFVAAICAFFTPNWKYAFICLLGKTVFTLLTVHSTACPINRFRCDTSLEPAQVFLSGVVVIVFFRLQTRTSAPATFLHILLDVLGYLYIIGSISVIVAFVDDERLESYRKLLIVLLYVVWASDTGAYLTGKLLKRLKYGYYNPLASHVSKNKDYEGTLGAILFGVAAMFISSDLLNVPGSAVAQTGFTVMAVIVGRLGDLFESLLKRAAGVKDSGKLIPGHGGVLDRIDALMFASLVFARYYAAIVM
ncbi:hypothetical protein CCR75_005981 [Bremia lactucae]|uniref:Phosphatidate cytidylyltransferase n=1 Tax=Bremia lactucae TaxID=4779 RepID=A0A976FIU6_BRELC|nr:hypothetical protein CCR75_005981 [Bremia lactucae]